jgi:hypothetical protein
MMGLLYRDGMLYYSSTFTVLVTGMLVSAVCCIEGLYLYVRRFGRLVT